MISIIYASSVKAGIENTQVSGNTLKQLRQNVKLCVWLYKFQDFVKKKQIFQVNIQTSFSFRKHLVLAVRGSHLLSSNVKPSKPHLAEPNLSFLP